MRYVISISLSEDTVIKLREKLRLDDSFRNKSHFIEHAIKKAIEGKDEKQ
jgi:Arc/MetJ-type ribon-helix-helix transcriptional regulator